MQPVVAVFVSPDFVDMGRLRVWARQLHSHDARTVVLLTDDPTDANSVLGRQLRCEHVVHAVVRTATTLRGLNELEQARRDRDAAMIAIATEVVLFGDHDAQQLAGKSVTRY